MKRIFTKLASVIAVSALAFGLAGCDEPIVEEDNGGDFNSNGSNTENVVDLKASLVSSGVDFLEIKVEAKGLDAVSYECYTEAQSELQASSILRSGKEYDVKKGENIRIDGLTGGTAYWVYFAGKAGSEVLDEVFELAVSTQAYDAVEGTMLTLVENTKRSFKVHLNVPQNVEQDETRSIRYAYTTLPMYISKKMAGMHDSDLLYQNGQVDTRQDITIEMSPENEYLLDENGNFVVDPSTGMEIQLHDPFVPGEPVIFMAGEFEWGEGYVANWGPNGDGWGYFVPMCDLEQYYTDLDNGTLKTSAMTKGMEPDMQLYSEEHPYWYGAFEKMVFTLEQPELLDAEIEVRYEQITPINATIKIIPDDNVYLYCYFVVDDATYENMVSLLGGREDWMQWFVSSNWIRYNFMVGQEQGPITVNVKEEFFADWLPEQTDFHLLITAIGDEEGASQMFVHEKFTTAARVLDAPIVNVTAVENNKNTYEAKFNIKAPNSDLVAAYYGANYVKDWIPEINDGATYASLCQNPLSDEDIQAINSAEGLTISIPSLDGQTTRLAVLGYNEEYTPNVLIAGCSAIADCSTCLLPLEPHIESPLFKDLVGDWTAVATVWAAEYDSNNNLQYFKKQSKTKITISDKVETPELTDEVYAAYAEFGWSKEAVDGYYEDFKKQAQTFNDYRLHYRNRLLCLGWFEKDVYDNPSRLSARSAFDLFCATDYQSVDNAELFYDFGPKWYLQIGEDGSVTVPVNQDSMPPMTFAFDYVFFVGGYDKNTNDAFKTHETGFPVQISSDKNTVTIKAVEENGGKYYMNAIAGWGQADASITEPVISEIKLTRGWKDGAKASSSRRAVTNYVEDVNLLTEDCERVVWKSMSDFSKIERINFKEVEPVVITMDKLEAAFAKYAK